MKVDSLRESPVIMMSPIAINIFWLSDCITYFACRQLYIPFSGLRQASYSSTSACYFDV